MKIEIPAPVRAEHEMLHAKLLEATREHGAVGETAREVARLLHPHFVREEEFALPPLGLLAEVARGGVTADMAQVLPMTRRLKAELSAMIAEHRDIVAALDRLVAAAREENLPRYERFAAALIMHAQTEEQVLYPAVILLGETVERQLGHPGVLVDWNGEKAGSRWAH
jgi:hypothetical protein